MNAAALVHQLRFAVDNARVLRAIGALPRERFVPASERDKAYDNVALPIGSDQTISQPLVVARMLELLDPGPDDRVLDVGTGSGYHAALLAMLAAHVWTIERHPELAERARQTVAELGIENISFVIGDGSQGLAAQAPFDAINVAAVASRPPPALVEQLTGTGRLVMPLGDGDQHLVVLRRTPRGLVSETHEAVRFVPLVRGP